MGNTWWPNTYRLSEYIMDKSEPECYAILNNIAIKIKKYAILRCSLLTYYLKSLKKSYVLIVYHSHNLYEKPLITQELSLEDERESVNMIKCYKYCCYFIGWCSWHSPGLQLAEKWRKSQWAARVYQCSTEAFFEVACWLYR